MEFSSSTIVLTKLCPPALRSAAIRRARLTQKIQLKPETGLILVSAPAGYGKTTLLVEWSGQLGQSGVGVVWYSLDESDSHPTLFATYLLTGLAQVLGLQSGLNPILQTLRSSPEIDFQKILPAVLNALLAAGREIVLVLDDYHLIHSAAIHRAIEYLLVHRPKNFHLAIGSRSRPALPLSRLRARDSLIEIRAADLRFTEQESGRFLRESLNIDLPDGVSNQLFEQLEGWPAGLQLAALSFSGSHPREDPLAGLGGGHKQLAEYLLEEVINRLPEDAQEFLLYSSILERMTASLCDAVLGIEQSAGLLQRLETANLFIIALDHQGTWFRYHHLFRDFLRDWLKKTQPEHASGLHRLACNWFVAHGSLREAADHAFQCGDWAFAADFVEQHSFDLIIQSEISTIYEWTSSFPEAVIQDRPRLCVFQALALAYHLHRQNRDRVAARLQQAERRLTPTGDAQLSLEVNELATVVRTFLAMIPDPGVDARRQLDLALAHLADYPENNPGRFSWLLIAGYCQLALHRVAGAASVLSEALPFAQQAGLFFGMVETTFHLARLARSQGRLSDALRICRQGQAAVSALLKETNPPFPALGCLEITIGDILLEQDCLEQAERSLQNGMERMGWGMSPYYMMVGWLAQFRLHLSQGRLEMANRCLEQLDLFWPDIQFLTQGLRAQAFLRYQPGPAAARRARDWLQSYLDIVGGELPLPGLGPIGAAEVYYQANLVWVGLQVALGDPRRVLPYLSAQLALARDQQLTGREIELVLLEAQAYRQIGDHPLAREKLSQALSLGRSAGYVRIFDQSDILDDLIHTAVRQGRQMPYAERILAAIRSARSLPLSAGRKTPAEIAPQVYRAGSVETFLEPLSSRELEVLKMMAGGATNRQIAARLVITLGTVKSHINHILRKLDAANRTEAVARARHNGLID
jgi:LuxR family maltose regulon positive regulatory protein